MTKTVRTNIISDTGGVVEAYIKIKDGIVTDVSSEPKGDYLDYLDWILGSCFFNIHCHLGESLYKLDDRQKWTIKKYIQYTEDVNANLSKDDKTKLWLQSAHVTAAEQHKNGISGICAARSSDICEKYRLNCMTGYPIMNSDKLKSYKDRGLEGFLEFLYNSKSNTCNVGVFFHSLYSNDSDSLKLAKSCMDNGGEFLTIHLSEDEETRDIELRTFKKQPVKVLEDYGLLNEKTIIVHGGFLSDEELDLIKRRNSTIAVCPISNKFLNTRLPNLYDIKKFGINWCIATDGLTTGKSFSLLSQIEEVRRNFPELSSYELYEACTRNCAKLFNRPIYTGRVSIGSEAKFIKYSMADDDFDSLISAHNKLEIIEL